MEDDDQNRETEHFVSQPNEVEEIDLSKPTAETSDQAPIHQPTIDGPIASNEITPKKHSKFPKTEKLIPNFVRKHLGKAARPISLILIVVILAAAVSGTWYFTQKSTNSKNGVTRFTAKIVAFKVLSTSPSKNQVNVSTTTSIAINFTQPVVAQKLQGNLFITPNVAGTFSQGKNSSQVIFTPNVPFAQGTKVQVMLNGTYQSKQGAKLGANFFYGFTTALPQDGVIFQDSSGLYATVSSAQTGQQEAYSLVFGSAVAPGVSVTLYKSDMNHLLNTLIYSESTSNGYSFPTFVDQPIDTSSMQVITTQKNLNNGSDFNVTENSGIYLAVATDSKGNQLGYVWVDYSDFGVLARQDDQKLVLDAQSLATSSDVNATVQIYNLQNSVDQLNTATVNGLTTITTPYTPSADVIVASDGTSQAIVPLSILNSQGDIRVDQNLSTAQSTYAITDRPTYSTSDTVKYSGFVRANQDALYQPTNEPLHLYVATNPGGTALASFTVQPDSNGMFSGSFNTSASWLGSDSSNQFQIYAASPDGNIQNDVDVASFTVTSQANASSNITVSFAKPSYLPNDTVQATITGTNANGGPLANDLVDVHTFSEDYYENDPTANLNNFDYIGGELSTSPSTLKLNSNGIGTYTLNVSNLPNDGNSQLVTVQANIDGQTTGAAGGASTIIHQGAGSLTFGPSRNAISTDGAVIGRVYANNLDGSPMANALINYSLVDSSGDTTYTTGSVTSNTVGYAVISIPVPSGVQDGAGLELNVWMSDADNNKIQASNFYYIQDSSDTTDTSGATLEELDVSGSPSNITVGQTVNLVINSPSALNAMVTFDRGRIYNPEMVQLSPGNNNFSFTVNPDLAPSFTLTFNYFEKGVYHSEGLQFEVSNPAKQASLMLTPSSGGTVTANTPTTVQISAKDSSGNPLQTYTIVDVVNEGAFNLYNQVEPDMFTSLYPLLPIMTSSSSSLSSIGSGGGGRCGGGGGNPDGFTNPIGTTLLWQPELATNSSGDASVSFTPPKGTWRVSVYSMDSNSVVGSASTTITAD
jgi:hypothetical protein